MKAVLGATVALILACGPRAKPSEVAEIGAERSIRLETLMPFEGASNLEDEVSGCPQLFNVSARSAWHSLSGERYYIDAAGRPQAAFTRLPVEAVDRRNSGCQSKTGRWGDLADPAHNYDGGHLIGVQLGGWGGRANLVPQEASFNRGNWAQVENALAGCDELEQGRLEYRVTVQYEDEATIIPSVMEIMLRDTQTSESIKLTFDNTTKGGPACADMRKSGVQWLRTLGCE